MKKVLTGLLVLISCLHVLGQAGGKPGRVFINGPNHGVKPNSGVNEAGHLNKLWGNNKNIYLPRGNYRITSIIHIANTRNLTVTGDANGTVIATSTLDSMLLVTGSCDSLVFKNITLKNTRVSTVDGATGLMLIYLDGARDTVKNVVFDHCRFIGPNINTNGVKIISQGTSSWACNIQFNECFFNNGRMGAEIQNHVYPRKNRYEHIDFYKCVFDGIETVHSGIQGTAISWSGNGKKCTGNWNTIRNVHSTKAWGVTNYAIENAGCDSLETSDNIIESHPLYGSGGFIGSGNSSSIYLVPLRHWIIKRNKGIFHNKDGVPYVRALYLGGVIDADIEDNDFTCDGNGAYLSWSSSNLITHNNFHSTLEQVVVEIADSSVNNRIINNTLSSLGTRCCNVVIRAAGAKARFNNFHGNKLIQSDSKPGVLGQISGAAHNDDLLRTNGMASGNYQGNPEGHVISNIGGLIKNTTDGKMYKKTAGNGSANGWVKQ